MDWTKIGGVLAEAGLTGLGTLIGGPLGGALGNEIGKTIADKLGVPPTPDDVAAAIQADPQAAKERLADIASARQADIDLARVEAESSANARQMQIVAMEHSALQENTPTVLAYLNFGLFATVMLSLLVIAVFRPNVEMMAGVKELLVFLLGHLSAGWKDSQAFFFGTSRSSERNGAAMRSIATSANVPPPAAQVGQAIGAAVGKAVSRLG